MPRKKATPISVVGGVIPVEIWIDGKRPDDLSPDLIKQLAGLSKNSILASEVRRFIGEKVKEWLAHPESGEFIQAQIYGISEFYSKLKVYEQQEQDGIKEDTIKDELTIEESQE